jgi:hypothetical protein
MRLRLPNSRLPESTKKRLRTLPIVLLALLAAISWWTVAEEGASNARVITAVTSTLAAMFQAVGTWRRRGDPGGTQRGPKWFRG